MDIKFEILDRPAYYVGDVGGVGSSRREWCVVEVTEGFTINGFLYTHAPGFRSDLMSGGSFIDGYVPGEWSYSPGPAVAEALKRSIGQARAFQEIIDSSAKSGSDVKIIAYAEYRQPKV